MKSEITRKESRVIPIADPGLEYEAIKQELDPLLAKILRSGSYVLGHQLAQFEQELSSYLETRHAIGVHSGTDAILLALRALGIQPGDEVIVPAMSFFATVEPVIQLGAKPVFVDIDSKSYTIDPKAVSSQISPKTKTIIAVHLYGLPADMKALLTLTQDKKISLIEDMAQAIGSQYEDKMIGSLGEMACVSFYPTKNLGACGDGGAVLTSSDALAEKVKSLRNHGAQIKYFHQEVAYNSRLDEIQAAILRLKLRRLSEWNEKRRALAAEYTSGLQGLPFTLPSEIPGRYHTYHLYSIQYDRRDDLKTFLQDKGISTGLHYPLPLPLLPALKHFGHKENDFPVSERLARHTLSLPLYPLMSFEDVHYVVDAVRQFF